MAGRRHTPEQIIRKLAEGQKLLAGGMDVEEVCRQFGIAESTWARWLSQYGGMKADDAKRLKELEGENARLKKLLAEAELDKAMLKELAEGKTESVLHLEHIYAKLGKHCRNALASQVASRGLALTETAETASAEASSPQSTEPRSAPGSLLDEHWMTVHTCRPGKQVRRPRRCCPWRATCRKAMPSWRAPDSRSFDVSAVDDTGVLGSVPRSRSAMSGTTAVEVVLDLEELLGSRFAADTDEDILVRVVGVLGS